MAEFPRVHWKTIDGKEVPFVEPQHFSGEGDEVVRTGDKNPLPTKDSEVLTALQSIKEENEEIKQTQSEILERLDGEFDTRLTGSNVEYPFVDKDYEGGVIQTRTMGLSWKAFDLFDENIFVPSGAYVDRKSDAAQVNGFSTIGIIVRDERGGSVAKHNFDVHIYWQGIEGDFAPYKAVNEVISFNNDEDEGTGLSVSVPTKSEFISFRLFNRSDEDRTYLAKGILRA